MKSINLIRIAGHSILKNKMRALLTMLGIVIGVGAVILMVAIGQGATKQIEATVQGLGTNMLVITPGAATAGGVSQGANTFNRLTIEDAEMLREQSYLLAAVSPVVTTRSQIVGGQGNWRAFIFGVHTDYQIIRDWPVEFGVFFDQGDIKAIRKVAVLGNTVAINLFGDEDPIGQQIRIRNVPFTVVGVLTQKGQTASGDDQDDIVLAPYTTVQNRLSGHQFITQILASTFSPDEIEAGQEEIRSIMRDAHGLSESQGDDFTVRNQAELAETAAQTTQVMTLLLSAIAGISLVVGGIGIMNIMLVSVTERTREIGLRMALGARGSDILTQFLVESIVLSSAGGLIGVAVGIAGGLLLGSFTGWAIAISPLTVLIALAFAGSVGVFFGFYPARRAAALDPIDALRYE
ncbi:MAG: ABC transporter permease [Candidatus Eisenbacteria bacterium]|uniref:ABC transporter permease n=1 Tax=Eiseniibacteriota bacterium TaxID=2212470 RepID=A0A948RXR4_UNCEI|nr:ABC transporter permease [Candidatus Eisenbacteria bacterium]MBU2691906.1 ABC transporter permease [Candidatus Eisenbacteria bacterium]